MKQYYKVKVGFDTRLSDHGCDNAACKAHHVIEVVYPCIAYRDVQDVRANDGIEYNFCLNCAEELS